jgi:hypothetical protein
MAFPSTRGIFLELPMSGVSIATDGLVLTTPLLTNVVVVVVDMEMDAVPEDVPTDTLEPVDVPTNISVVVVIDLVDLMALLILITISKLILV